MYARWFAAVIGLGLASSLYAAEVEVIVDSAPLKVGDQVIATVPRGRRLHLLQTKGPWLAVSFREGDREMRGWLLADKIRRVVDPKFEAATAPDAPVDFRIEADWVQVCASEDDKRRLLFLFLKLKNELIEPAKFSVDNVRLRVDEQSLSAVRLPAERENDSRPASGGFDASRGPGGFRGRGRFPFRQPLTQRDSPRLALPTPQAPPEAPPFSAENTLRDAELVAGGQVEGWLCFDLAPIAESFATPFGLSEKSFRLQLGRGEETLHLDLTAEENRKLGVSVRSSKYEPSVTVVELSPCINSLNVGSLQKFIKAFSHLDSRFLLVFRPGEMCVEAFADKEWDKSFARGRRRYYVVAAPGSASRGGFGGRGFQGHHFRFPAADSEEIGTVLVLAAREEPAAVLLPYLASEREATKAVAADALSSHLAEPDVANRLVAAASDVAPQVRAAAISALRTSRWKNRAPWPAESPAAQVILKALRDPAAPVRQAALMAAEPGWQDFEAECLRLLDDENESVRLTACGRAGAAKSPAAAARLKELQAGGDKQLAVLATTALQMMGELSALDAALARLKYGNPTHEDYDAVAKANDRRAVPELLSLLNGDTHHSRDAARALSEMRAPEAIEPLLAKLKPGELGLRRQPYVLALGKLGDSRAVAPIRELLKQRGEELDVAAYEALFMLNEPGVFEELANALKDAKNRNELSMALGVLARYGGTRAVRIIEPYLDQAEHCQAAAQSLTIITTPLAVIGIERRLKKADYPFGAQVLRSLQSNPTWLRSSLGKSLVQKAAGSENEATKKAAAELLETLEEEPDPAA